MRELTPDVTIVIVTDNLQQAGRVADSTAFLTSEVGGDGASLAGSSSSGVRRTLGDLTLSVQVSQLGLWTNSTRHGNA
jgi:hypothetical protein